MLSQFSKLTATHSQMWARSTYEGGCGLTNICAGDSAKMPGNKCTHCISFGSECTHFLSKVRPLHSVFLVLLNIAFRDDPRLRKNPSPTHFDCQSHPHSEERKRQLGKALGSPSVPS